MVTDEQNIAHLPSIQSPFIVPSKTDRQLFESAIPEQHFCLWLSPPCYTLAPLRDKTKGHTILSPTCQIGPQLVAQHALGLGRQAYLLRAL